MLFLEKEELGPIPKSKPLGDGDASFRPFFGLSMKPSLGESLRMILAKILR